MMFYREYWLLRGGSYLGCIDLKDPLVLPSLLDLPLDVTNGVTLHKLDRKITREGVRGGGNFRIR